LQRLLREYLTAMLHSVEGRRVNLYDRCQSPKTDATILTNFRRHLTERLRHESSSANRPAHPVYLNRFDRHRHLLE
jgi:hypothetical protein